MSFSRKSLTNRIIAGLLSFVMMLSLVMNVTPSKAAPNTEEDCFVILVKDDQGNPISGASVTYTIYSATETTDYGETDADGKIKITITADTFDNNGGTVTLDATAEHADYSVDTPIVGQVLYETSEKQIDIIMTPKPDIPVVKVEGLQGVYDPEVTIFPADAFSITYEDGEESSAYTVSYQASGTDYWTVGVPEIAKAGVEYEYTVKIEREGYKTYYAYGVYAKVDKAGIPESVTSSITPCSNREFNGSETPAITHSIDTTKYDVKYEYNGETLTESPKVQAIGTYKVTVKVSDKTDENYAEWTNEYTIVISKNNIPDSIITISDDLQPYTGANQQLATFANDMKGTTTYKVDYTDNSNITTEGTIETLSESTSLVGKEAGTYTITVYLDKDYYGADVQPIVATAVIGKADQEINYSTNHDETETIDVTCGNSTDGGSFTIKDSVLDSPNYTYKLVEYGTNTEVLSEIAEIDSTGKVTIYKGGCVITVVSTEAGDNNYNSAEKKTNLVLKCVDEDLLAFESTETIKYTLSDTTVVANRQATKKHSDDNGTVTYKIFKGNSEINYSQFGLAIDANGKITVDNKSKLNNELKKQADKKLTLKVVANKAYGKQGSINVYNEVAGAAVNYSLEISYEPLPADAYTLKNANDEILSSSDYNIKTVDGEQQKWYNTAIKVVMKEGYTVSKTFDGNYEEYVVFDDQGEADRRIYIKKSGKQCEEEIIDVKYIDTVAPNLAGIDYSESDIKDGVKYYGKNKKLKITFTGEDANAGIKNYYYAYYAKGQSAPTAPEKFTKVNVNAAGKGVINLPTDEDGQLDGNIVVYAVDYAGNKSALYPDGDNPFVVDTISPEVSLSYKYTGTKGTAAFVDGVYYAPGTVEFTFEFKEANLFKNDVKFTVEKDGTVLASDDVNVTWNDKKATLKLSGQGEYKVGMSYKDRSGNNANIKDKTNNVSKNLEYQSKLVVIDTKAPVVSFAFDKDTQTATVTVKEKYFDKKNLKVVTDAKYINGNKASVNNLQTYLDGTNKNSKAVWESKGNDTYVATISNYFTEAIYNLTFDYTDYASNKAETVKSGTFLVDKTAPDYTKMSVSYSQPITEQLLSTITFGYYNPNVKVTFTAYDVVSGVDYFTWSYNKQSGASDTNLDKYAEQKVKAVQDSKDKTKFTATITLPLDEAKQLRGNIAYQATDKYANSSKKVTDSGHVIVVDTIAPNVKAEYSEPVKSAGSKKYYNKEVAITFDVKEANFDKKDVKVVVTKNGTEVALNTSWKDTDVDNHVGTLIIPANADHSNDGDYVVTVNYTDKSNNSAKEVKLGTFVIDTTNPIIAVSYANTNPVYTAVDAGNSRDYFDATQTATVKITERNFNSSNVKFIITAKDVAGNDYNVDSYIKKSSWTSEGNVHTMTITYPGDANYSFDVEYTDEATNDAANYATDYFTVDKTAPTNLDISLSDSLMNTVLQNVTFGFYNAKVTVTVTAEDSVSRVHKFEYNAKNAAGVSSVNAEIIKQALEEADITYTNGGKTATAKFEIPRAALGATNQFNGSVDFIAIDRSNNESEDYKDSTRIVVDNISPVADVQYNEAVNKVDGVSYYDGNITSTITITEANFFADDVKVTATKNGTNYPVNVTWSDESVDKHIGTFTLNEDGDYIISIEYKDKSNNNMASYKSSQLTIDTALDKPVITVNGEDGNNKAYKDSVVPGVKFNDINLDKYEVKLLRTVFDKKNADVTEEFISGNLSDDGKAVDATFDVFEKIKENDGIYTLSVNVWDKANHQTSSEITFSVNRFGSVYAIDGVADLKNNFYNKKEAVKQDIVITEYNADVLDYSKISISITRDGKPVENPVFTITPAEGVSAIVGENGWYEYKYLIDKSNFQNDGLYKISVTSEDKAGNTPQNTGDNDIQFYVDNTAPEITSITGLEKNVINATEVVVKYTVFDAVGLKTVTVYVDGKAVDTIEVKGDDINNYSGEFKLSESSSEQKVVIVVEDLAGNKISTAGTGEGETKGDVDFDPAFKFNDSVTVSTNFFVRWYANKAAFWGSIIGFLVAVGGAIFGIITLKKKKEQ